MIKNAFIVILVIALAVGIIFYGKETINKKRDYQRSFLGGMTSAEFVDWLTKLWQNEYKNAQTTWLKKQPEYDLNMIINRDGVSNAMAKAWRDEQIALSVEGSFSTGITPHDHAWAMEYWIPTLLAKKNIDMQKQEVQDLIRKVSTV